MPNKNATEMFLVNASWLSTFIKRALASLEPDLNTTQKRTLLCLRQLGGLPMKRYSQMVSLQSGSFTYAAEALEKKGLVRRQKSEDDHRKRDLILTEQGRVVAQNLHEQLEAWIERELAPLTAAQRRKLMQAFSILEEISQKIAPKYKGL